MYGGWAVCLLLLLLLLWLLSHMYRRQCTGLGDNACFASNCCALHHQLGCTTAAGKGLCGACDGCALVYVQESKPEVVRTQFEPGYAGVDMLHCDTQISTVCRPLQCKDAAQLVVDGV
jgi:hypothetical protein